MNTVYDRIERLAGRALFRLPVPAAIPPVIVDGQTLHRDLQLLLAVRKALGSKSVTEGTPRQARQRMRRDCVLHAGPPLAVDAVRDLALDGLRARHYRPRGGRRPLVLYLHGGGFVVGDLDTADIVCRYLCRHADVHVLSIDYRLAPEEPFPAAVEDARAAFHWTQLNAASLGADATRIAIAGDSAGGHLCAVLTQELARAGMEQPAAQLLLYPATCRRVVRPSLELFAHGFMLERRDVEWFHFHYSGFLGPDHDIRLRPLDGLAEMKTPLAPAIVVTAGFDPLRDEGEDYAHRLRALGTTVKLRRFEDMIHGFANIAGVSAGCRHALVEVAQELARVLA